MTRCQLSTGQAGETCPVCGWTCLRDYDRPPVVPCGQIKQTERELARVGKAAAPRTKRRNPKCVHRGAPIGDLARYQARTDKPCNSRVRVPIYRCLIHGECTKRPNRDGLACCQDCESVTAG